MNNHFSQVVSAKLKCYVYRLIDPRSGITFYVGRGKGNRVFSHAAGTERPTDAEEGKSSKLDLIHAIIRDGFQVEHVIHRHGMSDEIAREVEAALIDAYPGLTNIQAGYDGQRGAMHAKQAIRLYEAEEATFRHKVILFRIDRKLKENPMMPIAEAVSHAWNISRQKAEKAEYVLAVAGGLIRGTFVAKHWRHTTPENFPRFPTEGPERFGFDADDAPKDVQEMYLQKRVPRAFGAPFNFQPKASWRSSQRRQSSRGE